MLTLAECIPSERERMALYSVQYIESLEARIAGIQHEATLVTPGMSLDEPEESPSQHPANYQTTNELLNRRSVSDQLDMTFMAPLDASSNMLYDLDMLQSEGNLFSISNTASVDRTLDCAMPVHESDQGSAPTFAQVSIRKVLCFFRSISKPFTPGIHSWM